MVTTDVNIDILKPYAKNAKKHPIEQVAETAV